MNSITRILLYSGGWDSTLAAHIYPEAHKLYIDLKTLYSSVEINNLPDNVKIISLNMNEFVMNNGHHMPQRNAIFAMLATAYGMTFGNENIEIIIGGLKEDINMSDKNPTYFKALENLINMFYNSNSNQTEHYNIKIIAFFDYDKITLWEKANKPNMRNIISCYHESGNCGKCLDCYRRLVQLKYLYPEEYNDVDTKFMLEKLKENGWLMSDVFTL